MSPETRTEIEWLDDRLVDIWRDIDGHREHSAIEKIIRTRKAIAEKLEKSK